MPDEPRGRPSRVAPRGLPAMAFAALLVLAAPPVPGGGGVHAAEIALAPGGPIATPEAARDAARVAARTADKPVRIVVADGTYRLTAPLALTAEDSATEWVAAQGASPVFSGGEPVTGWRERDGLWVAPMPAAQAGRRFEQLWVNGRRAVRARHPNRGFLHVGGPAAPGTFADEAFAAENAETAKLGFHLGPAEHALLAAIPPAERDGLLVTVTHDWAVSQARVAALDDATRSVRIRGRARYPFAAKGRPAARLWLENYAAALDEPGEWHLDAAAGELCYKPLPGERPDAVEAVVPVAARLVTISGVRDVAFRGITFMHDDDRYPAAGLFEGQAAPGIGAAIEVAASRGVRFERCMVAHVGRHAIHFRDGCADSRVTHCRLEDLGGGGVLVGETARPPHDQVCEGIVIDDCIIRAAGRRHPSACGVTFTHTRRCAVTHCDIGDLYYTGVSAGWNWGYGESASRETLVENNRIHHLGWGYLSDMGGFYGLGTSPGTVIRGNHVHHVQSHRYGGWGIYYDEGSCDSLAENNLVHDTSDTGFHQHYGYANRVRNNIFAFGRRAQVHRTRNEPRLCFIFERNIVLWDAPATLLDGGDASWATNPNPAKGEPADTVVFRDNLYWRTDGTTPGPLNAGTITWDSWRKLGRDRGSLFADPLFVDAAARDFRLRPESPAAKIGFQAWDLGRAGVRDADPAWRAEAARGHVRPEWERDSQPWPAP